MANVYAIIPGNWSNPLIWNTGALPTASDDVFANGLIVQVDVTTTVLSVRSTAATPIVAGGTFILNNGSNLTCTGAQGIFMGSITSVIQFTGGAGTSAILRGFFPAATTPSVGGYVTILHSGIGSLTVTSLPGGTISYLASNVVISRSFISSTSTGTVIINSNISVSGGGSSANTCILMSGGILNINATTITNAGTAGSSILTAGTSAVTITGSISSSSTGLSITGGSSITVIGDVTNTGTGLLITATTAAVEITGAVTVSNTGVAVSSTTGAIKLGGPISVLGPSGANNVVASTLGLVRCSGLLTNFNQWQAVFAPKITIEATTSSITYQTFASGNQIMYVGSSGALGQPTTNNVRFGTVYGAASEFTGTLRVPNPNTVLLGTLTDNTTGTYTPSSPSDYVNELNISSIAVAVRLRNCATVDTTGSQIASYNI